MLHRTLFVCLAFLFVGAIFPAYGDVLPQSLQFTDTNAFERSMGLMKKCDTEYATYFVDNDEIAAFASDIEMIQQLLKNAGEHIPLRKSGALGGGLNIYFSANGVPETAVGKCVLVPNTNCFTGKILFTATNSRYPAWLCVGLEAYYLSETFDVDVRDWVREAAKNNHPAFGDAWFIPDYLDAADRVAARAIACQFVAYLMENEIIGDIFERYDADGAREIIDLAWRRFVRIDDETFDHDTRYLYGLNGSLFSVNTAKAMYSFEAGRWNYEKVQASVKYMEASIRYIEDWFGREMNKIECGLYSDDRNDYSHGITRGNNVSLYNADLFSCSLFPHEAGHAMTYGLYGVLPDFLPFSEGLSEVISYLFEEEYKGTYYTAFEKRLLDEYRNSDPTGMIDNYNRYSRTIYEPESGVFLHPIRHYYAYCAILEDTDPVPFTGGNAARYASHPKYHHDLQEYITSNSFVYYLIDTYGKDKFMSVYANLDLFEDAYEQDLSQVVQAWKDYLVCAQ